MKRMFLIVLDSFGIGALPDAGAYGDAGSNTLGALRNSGKLRVPNMERLGLFQIAGVEKEGGADVAGSYGRAAEKSKGKDTTTGHWEIAGIISDTPMPTYPDGFPDSVLADFKAKTGRGVLCNKPYSGTAVIHDYGRESIETGSLIVYTSADSVFQVAAHEAYVPLEKLYEYCEVARGILCGEHGVGRVIARPFTGEYPNYIRTKNRHDFSLQPPARTMLDALSGNSFAVIGVGKIKDIFAGVGITDSLKTADNDAGMAETTKLLKRNFSGLAFVNLVDFDMLYGHRNDVAGYTDAMNRFDDWLGGFMNGLHDEDVLLVTADHGCDPSTPSTDHSREYIPILAYGKHIRQNHDIGTRKTFADISATVQEMFALKNQTAGSSFWAEISEFPKTHDGL